MALLIRTDWIERTSINSKPIKTFLVKKDLILNFSSIVAKNPANTTRPINNRLLSVKNSPKNKYPSNTVITALMLNNGAIADTSRFFKATRYSVPSRAKAKEAKRMNVQFVARLAPLIKEMTAITELPNVFKLVFSY